MKMKLSLFATIAITALCGAAHAADNEPGDKQQCVRLQAVGQTPVIDDRTILIEMKGGREFKRIDLINTCPGLKIQGGFAFDTSTQNICTSNALTVLNRGATCIIKDIVTIDKAEATALKARR